jgi:hypothetical protein
MVFLLMVRENIFTVISPWAETVPLAYLKIYDAAQIVPLPRLARDRTAYRNIPVFNKIGSPGDITVYIHGAVRGHRAVRAHIPVMGGSIDSRQAVIGIITLTVTFPFKTIDSEANNPN